MRKPAIAVMACLILVASMAMAQTEKKKPLSPPTTAEGKIGGKNVSVSYSAPSKRNRVIMGELVPYGQVWRTGANAATTLKTEADLMIGDLHVPAGTYTLFTVPGEKQWTLIVNKQTGQWGTNHDATQDLGRVPMTVKTLKAPVETFAIGVKPGSGANGTLTRAWENVEASGPLMAH